MAPWYSPTTLMPLPTRRFGQVIFDHIPTAIPASDADAMSLFNNLIADFQMASLWMMVVAGVAAAVGVAAQLATSIIDNQKGLTALRMTGSLGVVTGPIEAQGGHGSGGLRHAGEPAALGVWAGAFFADIDLTLRPFVQLLAVTAAALAMTLLAETATRPSARPLHQ